MLHTKIDSMASSVERASAQCFLETAEKRMRGDPGKAGKDQENCSSVSVVENGTPSPCKPNGTMPQGERRKGRHIFLTHWYRCGVFWGVAAGNCHSGDRTK
jgi:hypothetical protein